ncbi:hypothetical protein RFI_12347 [Reticulomyxa filosa]|uniref:Peptidase C14 caspase domain-containing protein n=1 Tax=Reticulomyxa filosa TaxID=46433 RepID=X6NGB8_RETFI|nr:hypothetical protein RFI_12347 [Reticulomyxa filosa]|eukprot:ETO24809.1 hypothetical protein RFI_12347 [Reticulomyxa filosa]
MSFKAYIKENLKEYTIMLEELTVKNLQCQIRQVTGPTSNDETSMDITDEDGCYIKTDKDVVDAFKKDSVFFTVHVRSNQKNILTELESKEEIDEKRQTTLSCEVKNPLILLTGAMRYEQHAYLEGAKQDIYLLRALFEQGFGYQVFSTFDPQNSITESLTSNGLNAFIYEHCANLTNNANSQTAYDGLIFVWCGYGGFDIDSNTLITSDNKTKYFKDIQQICMTKTQFLVEKPKVFINITYRQPNGTNYIKNKSNVEEQNVQNQPWHHCNAKAFTIFANVIERVITNSFENKSENAKRESYFTEAFCQIAKQNADKSLKFIFEQVTNSILDPTFSTEVVETIPASYFDIYLTPRLRSDKQEIQSVTNDPVVETLDFKKHWNRDWKKSNAEAARRLKQMIKDNEQGLIIIAKNSNLVRIDRDASSFIALINNSKTEKKHLGNIRLNIDGNVLSVNCELQCKENTNITTQLFVTKNSIVHCKCISPIQWDSTLHHDIPVQLQNLQNQANYCSENTLFDGAILHLQTALQISMDTFGLNHPHVADFCNNIGNAYSKKGRHSKAIECYKKTLKIYLSIFGSVHSHVADLYYNLGRVYKKKGDYDKSIEFYEKALKIYLQLFGINHIDIAETYNNLGNAYSGRGNHDKSIDCHQKALKIRKEFFGNTNQGVGDSCWNLGLVLEKSAEKKTACEYFEESWRIYSIVLGEWDEVTLQAKEKVIKLSKELI